jgi:hypothetical protein
VRLEPEDAERLRELCRGAGCSQADWIAQAVKRAGCYDLAMMELAFNFQPKTSTPKPPPVLFFCAYCREPIKSGQPTVPDEWGDTGARMHIGCAAEDQDGRDLDRDMGDS